MPDSGNSPTIVGYTVNLKMNYEGVSNKDYHYCAIFGTCHCVYKNGNITGNIKTKLYSDNYSSQIKNCQKTYYLFFLYQECLSALFDQRGYQKKKNKQTKKKNQDELI